MWQHFSQNNAKQNILPLISDFIPAATSFTVADTLLRE
jgi:hypothetical protein